MKQLIVETIENAKQILYWDTSMCLDMICEELAKKGLNATFSGRSIYIDDTRAASIKVCKEAENAVGIYDYTILIKG